MLKGVEGPCLLFMVQGVLKHLSWVCFAMRLVGYHVQMYLYLVSVGCGVCMP
jgi:hypothetical protein